MDRRTIKVITCRQFGVESLPGLKKYWQNWDGKIILGEITGLMASEKESWADEFYFRDVEIWGLDLSKIVWAGDTNSGVIIQSCVDVFGITGLNEITLGEHKE